MLVLFTASTADSMASLLGWTIPPTAEADPPSLPIAPFPSSSTSSIVQGTTKSSGRSEPARNASSSEAEAEDSGALREEEVLGEEERQEEAGDRDNDDDEDEEGDSGVSADSVWEEGGVVGKGSMGAALTDIGRAAATNGSMNDTIMILQEGLFDLANSIIDILLTFQTSSAL